MSQLSQNVDAGNRPVLGGKVEGVMPFDARSGIVRRMLPAGRLFGFVQAKVDGRHFWKLCGNMRCHAAVNAGLATGERAAD